MSDIMTENEQTCRSELAPHRFVPYHFKGLTKAQQDDIMAQRDQQIVDAKLARKNQNTEEYNWAVQNLANTQHYLNNEIDLKDKQLAMEAAHKTTNLKEKEEKYARWPNMYGDLNPIPDVTKDMVAGADPRPIK